MSMTREEARGFVLAALRKPGWNQIESLMIAVGEVKAQALGLKQTQQYFGSMDGRQFLERGEKSLVSEVIWSLIFEGVVSPGVDDSNLNLPFLRVTEYGEECLKEDRFVPHDPEGYLVEFHRVCPGVDPIITAYLTEALQCYLRSLHKSAAVMLGAASEQAILLLIEAWLRSIQDEARRVQLTSQVNKANSIFKKFELFQRHLAGFRADLPRESSENLDSLLVSVFDLIRNSRNDAGHPARMSDITRETNYAHLRLFVPYCQRIYGLNAWLASNAT